jgi:hypothetical protein
MGMLLNEKKIDLPPESLPLWRMLYRNGGLSQLLFKQYIWPCTQLVTFKKGSQIPTDNCLYVILDGIADTEITLHRAMSGDKLRDLSPKISSKASSSFDNTSPQNNKSSSSSSGGNTPYSKKKMAFQKNASNVSTGTTTVTHRNLALSSGEMINIKVLQLFRAGSESEAFANQTVSATAATDMTCYKINDVDIQTMATRPQTKNAFQVKGFFFGVFSAIIVSYDNSKFPCYPPHSCRYRVC